eukprot:m.420217 g.420217  ORF g.420217 m.420217 type:complete len:172 (-) comp32310_c0_seq1:304-819(-)
MAAPPLPSTTESPASTSARPDSDTFKTPTDFKEYLRGEWRLQRRIDDRKARRTGSFIGQCHFTDDDAGVGLICREEGQVRIGDFSNSASRTYYYVFRGPTEFSLTTDDGEVLLDLDVEFGSADGTHLCAPDTYRGRVEILTADSWTQTWTVSGPAKDYTLDSRLTRVKIAT